MAQDQTRSGQFVPSVRRPISDESWIEVSSRPSSSSLSSAATDEVVTTGLRVSQDVDHRRRRRLFRSATTQVEGRIPLRASVRRSGSSHEEYAESEGDSDRLLSSSNEELQPRFMVEERRDDSPLSIPKSIGSDGDSLQDDEDETATALGPVNSSPVFTPQPNVFSHPPSGRLMQAEADSYFPPLPSSHAASSPRPIASTSSSSAPPTIRHPARPRSHAPYNVIAPSISVDHDAALRASLSTLLSCAAAARGLQKRETTSTTEPSRSIAPPRTRGVNQAQPRILRIIPESALSQVQEYPKEGQSSDTPSSSSGLPAKRKSKSPIRDRRKRNRSVQDVQHEDIMSVSPTLTTWVVGAGVLVLFSAISFTAGYTLGKEVGRVDSMGRAASASNTLSCASEVDAGGISRGLARRSGWRWGNASGVSV